MKKNAKLRLSLNRETLRTLDASELEAAPGGMNSYPYCVIVTNTCPTRCGGTCSGTTATC
jgi:hypothetical protein